MQDESGRPTAADESAKRRVVSFRASRNARVTLSAKGGAYSVNPGNLIYQMFRGGGKPALGPSTTVWRVWHGGFFV